MNSEKSLKVIVQNHNSSKNQLCIYDERNNRCLYEDKETQIEYSLSGWNVGHIKCSNKTKNFKKYFQVQKTDPNYVEVLKTLKIKAVEGYEEDLSELRTILCNKKCLDKTSAIKENEFLSYSKETLTLLLDIKNMFENLFDKINSIQIKVNEIKSDSPENNISGKSYSLNGIEQDIKEIRDYIDVCNQSRTNSDSQFKQADMLNSKLDAISNDIKSIIERNADNDKEETCILLNDAIIENNFRCESKRVADDKVENEEFIASDMIDDDIDTTQRTMVNEETVHSQSTFLDYVSSIFSQLKKCKIGSCSMISERDKTYRESNELLLGTPLRPLTTEEEIDLYQEHLLKRLEKIQWSTHNIDSQPLSQRDTCMQIKLKEKYSPCLNSLSQEFRTCQDTMRSEQGFSTQKANFHGIGNEAQQIYRNIAENREMFINQESIVIDTQNTKDHKSTIFKEQEIPEDIENTGGDLVVKEQSMKYDKELKASSDELSSSKELQIPKPSQMKCLGLRSVPRTHSDCSSTSLWHGVTDKTLLVSSLKAKGCQKGALHMTVLNCTESDTKVYVDKGQVLENKNSSNQNLAVGCRKEFTIKANEELSISLDARCMDRVKGEPIDDNMNVTPFQILDSSKVDDTTNNELWDQLDSFKNVD